MILCGRIVERNQSVICESQNLRKMATLEEDAQSQSQHEANNFKAFLLKTSTKTNLSLYEHLVSVLTKVMDERPENAADVIEDLSWEVKRLALPHGASSVREAPPTSARVQLAQQQRRLFIAEERNEGQPEQSMVDTALPNLDELRLFLEQSGICLAREEMWKIFLDLNQLVEAKHLQFCRLWGKILGIEGDYIIAEGQYRDGQEEDEEDAEEAQKDDEREEEAPEEPEGEDDPDNPHPRSTYKPPPVVPKEPLGSGTNKFTYFVCREPGLPWVRLPNVTPAQIATARQIRKLFTGRLDAPIVSFPPFPGNEANYLRAQIARISAATQVSPLGFYRFKEEEEEEVEDAVPDSIEENLEFEGVPVQEMAESLSSWVHHIQYILPQGRCIWFTLAEKAEQNVEEEAEEDEKEEDPDEPEPEVGPPLLTPLSEDAEVNNIPPWSTSMSSNRIPQHAIAIARSNLWPGGYAFACGKKFENVYVGWGLKSTGSAFSPALPPQPQLEYPSGPEITEELDPSLEEEQALEAALEDRQVDEENEGLDEEDDEEEEEEDD